MRSISWQPDLSESTRGTSISQRYAKLSHEIEASREWSASPKKWRPNPEIAQHPERSDRNSMRSPNIEHKYIRGELRRDRYCTINIFIAVVIFSI